MSTFSLAAKNYFLQTLRGSLIAGNGVTAGELSGIACYAGSRQEDYCLLGLKYDASGK
jgi:hypothetical protein